ncbi:SDR family NAD(P)-dependent oxidoreductase [Aquincola sp. S2]|uniref:SDR family NAD(P)-dependent oxidoreductase n=1 Tax=Pseudaquabacterium terrae TaxID=2732868 RepID=A0ABX2EHC7_9BURK|nr:SDR family NAD(P)-dependent oxidoreductase [Aquabacterium terrae]NRF68024.1 SDR family NAD(P)-dependent oxidoreductase [Aquabacterium terrae]
MQHHLYIVTGSSRGLGAALVGRLLKPEHVVLGIARHANPALQARAETEGGALAQWPLDLNNPLPVAERLRGWLADIDAQSIASATLINNAAAIGGGAPLGQVPLTALSNALRVGLEAALLLSATFLEVTANWSGQRRVLNISSGLGRRAMAGSAAYCAAKAGMDHFSRALQLEQAGEGNPARIVAMAPGVIDTDMQVELRAADPSRFPERERFVQMQNDGLLVSADACAEALLARLARDDFGSEVIADLRS